MVFAAAATRGESAELTQVKGSVAQTGLRVECVVLAFDAGRRPSSPAPPVFVAEPTTDGGNIDARFNTPRRKEVTQIVVSDTGHAKDLCGPVGVALWGGRSHAVCSFGIDTMLPAVGAAPNVTLAACACECSRRRWP